MKEEALDGLHIGAPKNRKMKVLYVAGWGRSGSTILGRILGQVRNFFLVGELRYIWDRGLLENRLCSCGMPFRECHVWREIISQAFEGENHIDAQELVRLRERELRTRHLLAPSHKYLQAKVAQMGEYQEALEKLYRAAWEVNQSRVIVDTSKFPSYGYVLQNLPDIDLYVLHLVRDPRAVAYSWVSRKKPKMDKDGSNSFMTPHGYVESSLVWDEWNLAIENAWRRESGRYMLLRYEDFVGSPRSSVESILRFLGEEESEPPFTNEREITLEATHTFSGNPDRFQSGTVKIEPDETWRSNISVARQAIVTALTWPGLVRYKYPLWPRRA